MKSAQLTDSYVRARGMRVSVTCLSAVSVVAPAASGGCPDTLGCTSSCGHGYGYTISQYTGAHGVLSFEYGSAPRERRKGAKGKSKGAGGRAREIERRQKNKPTPAHVGHRRVRVPLAAGTRLRRARGCGVVPLRRRRGLRRREVASSTVDSGGAAVSADVGAVIAENGAGAKAGRAGAGGAAG